MKLKRSYLIVLLGLFVQGTALTQHRFESRTPSLPAEKWWGGGVALGAKMPFDSTTDWFETDIRNFNNQIAPFLLSSKGRYIWCENPFRFRLNNDTLIIYSDYEEAVPVNAGKTLRDAYLAASKKHFPFTGTIPQDMFFSKPQYNTWIELMYNQNQHDILDDAYKVLENGFPTGFLDMGDNKLDEELIVRSCQIHAMMPMMQFSVAPWRILSRENMEICRKCAHLHEQMGSYILEYAYRSSTTNEPIVRSMEYQYPNQGFVNCTDQFMLGDNYLVAPMVEKGYSRKVKLPKGKWKDDKGRIFKGPKTLQVDVPIDRLPYYELVK